MIIQDLIQKRRLTYAVEGSKDGYLCGWIFERDGPLRRIRIEVEPAASQASSHLADLYRADVHRAGLGSDGYCGFAIPTHALGAAKIRLRADQPQCVFAHWPKVRRTRAIEFSPFGDLLFHLDPQDRPISGWLSSFSEPHDRRSVRIEVDGRQVFEQRSCLFRQDPPAQAIDAFHGFSVPVPARVGEIRITDVRSGHLLHQSRR